MQKTQFSKGIFWRSLVEPKTKETFVLLDGEVTEAWYLPLVLFLIQLHNFPSVASLAQSSKVQNGPDSSLFCRDTGSIRDRSIFFFRSISLLLSKTKTSI